LRKPTITFLKNQYVRQDELEIPFFAGCFGIFGHGNVAGLGEALRQNPDFMYYQARNEQAMVHTGRCICQDEKSFTNVCLHSFNWPRIYQYGHSSSRSYYQSTTRVAITGRLLFNALCQSLYFSNWNTLILTIFLLMIVLNRYLNIGTALTAPNS
jgi:hypothetical protein